MNALTINADLGKHTISKHIYGHFSEHLGRCIYDGYWVGEDSPVPNTRGIRNDIVDALKKIKIPNLRWPGGCFADEYHWMDGIGPREDRPTLVNTHWGGVTENNHFGTHEFLDLCEQLETEAYICGNVGSGTVQEMCQWVEYVNCDKGSPMSELRKKNGRRKAWGVKFWGVGNENWGCGGLMRPEFYADQYRRYACYCRNFPPNNLFKIACGPCGENYDWTEVLMREAGRFTNGLALHYYCGSGDKTHSATKFGERDWFRQLKQALVMDDLVTKHSTIMDKYDPEKNCALVVDEWGAWHDVEPGTNPGFLHQQNSLRDALVASVTLDVFNNHCDRVRMAEIAQTVNVLQAMILTEGEKMLLTPTYHVFDMYTVHHDATMLPMDLACDDYEFGNESIPAVSASASKDANGKVHITMSNLDPNKAKTVTTVVRGAKVRRATGRVLTSQAITDHNTFGKPNFVKPKAFSGAKIAEGKLKVRLPAKSVVALELS